MQMVELYVPKLEDLWFYQKMMSDPETMSYNANWDVEYDGYHRDTGCIDYPDEVLPDWYESWVGQEPDCFYAYIKRSSDGVWIGDVNFHYTPEKDWWDMGIVIYAPYRGKGYAVPALKLMLDHAFRDCGISRIHNDFANDRNEVAAWETHRKAGFKELGVEDGFLQMMITREDSTVICYGKPFDEMEGNIIHVSYEETNNYSPKAYVHELIRQIPQIPKDLTYEKGGGHAISSNKFPTNDGQIKHIFRKKENHVPDTSENRDLFLRVCNDESNYLGTDRYGKRWYAQILPDGRQVWVCTRDGIIQNCGINETARPWDADEGISQSRRKGVEQKMEKTPCRRAFLSMFYLLDSVYSRFPYNNLGVVLSDICPFTFKDSMSADPAAWDDFCEYYKEAEGAYSGEIEVGYYTALRFLRVYEEEWDFPIPYAMEEFTNEKYREYYYKQDV